MCVGGGGGGGKGVCVFDCKHRFIYKVMKILK